jgi:hypothetical protein
MTLEGASGLSVRLIVDQTAPVSSPAGVQGQGLPAREQGKPRRRGPPAEPARGPAEEAAPEEDSSKTEEEDDPPLHRVDSLA